MGGQKEQFLLFRVRTSRDQRAFGELHRIHAPGLLKFLRGKLPSPQDADDAASAVFLRFWTYATSTHIDNASATLYTIARNVVVDFYRKRKETVPLEDEDGEAHLKDSGAHERLLLQADLSLVRRAIDALHEEYQTVLLLRYANDLSVRKIAERMERTEGSITMLLHRAHKALKEKLTSHENTRS